MDGMPGLKFVGDESYKFGPCRLGSYAMQVATLKGHCKFGEKYLGRFWEVQYL